MSTEDNNVSRPEAGVPKMPKGRLPKKSDNRFRDQEATAAGAQDTETVESQKWAEAGTENMPEGSKLAERIAQRQKAARVSVTGEETANVPVEGQETDLEAQERIRRDRLANKERAGGRAGDSAPRAVKVSPMLPSVKGGSRTAQQVPGRLAVSQADDRPTRIRKFVGRNILVIVSAMILLVTLLVASSVLSARSEAIDRQQSEILLKQAQQRDATAKSDRNYSEVMIEATGGMDLEQKVKDDREVKELMEKALTWDGLSQYLENRESIKRGFGMTEESQFLRDFMPGEIQGVARKAPDGTVFYNYDVRMKNKFDSLDTWVISVDNGVYKYAGLVGMITFNEAGDASPVTYSTLHYDVVDGKITNMVAEPATGGVTKSG